MSRIDVSKLANVVKKDGKTVARCPACAARGGDATGNNLVVFDDGKFGCVAAPKNKAHNRMILQLVGSQETTSPVYRVPVRRFQHTSPKVIKVVGHFGRGLSTASAAEARANPSQSCIQEASEDQEPSPGRPGEESFQTENFNPEAKTVQTIRPKVPQKIQEQQKRLIWHGGGGFDPDILDEHGNPTRVV